MKRFGIIYNLLLWLITSAKPTVSLLASLPKTTGIIICRDPLFVHQERNVITLQLDDEESTRNMQFSRRYLFHFTISSATFFSMARGRADAIPEQKSYSANARNMDRLSSGDSSGGSTYNNSPTSVSASKRRAMLGCKIEPSRKEAMKMEGMQSLSEKDCNLKVMDGDTEFMLKALRELDCPTCPYGIRGA